MAEEFQTGICSSGSWWSTARTGAFDGPIDGPMMTTSVSCSTEFTNVGGSITWAAAADMVEAKSRSSNESPGSVSNSSITFQDAHKPHASDQLVADPIMDSTLHASDFVLSSPSISWNQPFLTTTGRVENNLHAVLQEDMNSRPYVRHELVTGSDQLNMTVENSSSNLIEDLKQGLMQGQHPLSPIANTYPLFPASFGLPPVTLLQGLFEPETKHLQSFHDQRMNSPINFHGVLNESLPSQVVKLPQLNKALSLKQQQLFSNNTPFWNPSATGANETNLGLYSSSTTELAPHAFDGKINCSNPLVKSNSSGVCGVGDCSSNDMKKTSEPAFKKSRIETPSPLPTFKVRKEKLGDRVTALQQLVSPFGKTDTASVLHEAIEYIKFLHEQVGALSAPYLKNGHPLQHLQNSDKAKGGEGPKLDLKSRGLCLVPISSTYAVASETPVDFWTPTFGGNYR